MSTQKRVEGTKRTENHREPMQCVAALGSDRRLRFIATAAGPFIPIPMVGRVVVCVSCRVVSPSSWLVAIVADGRQQISRVPSTTTASTQMNQTDEHRRDTCVRAARHEPPAKYYNVVLCTQRN